MPEKDAEMELCLKAAAAAGHTTQEAEICDFGYLDCPGCPWGGKEEIQTWKKPENA
jgi:hypothetical protein